MHAIRFLDITLAFNGIPLFDHFSCEIEAGRCTCLLGPSGCGKSTMLAMVMGAGQPPASGTISFEPEIAPHLAISWMAQNDLLLPWLKVRDNVLLGAKMRGEVDSTRIQKADLLLEEAGLGKQCASFPDELSGGMRQRVALLRTLMEERPIILMDEPFSSLDALTRMKLQNMAARMTNGKTVLMVTHDPLEALRLADRILVLGESPVRVVSDIKLHGHPPRRAEDHEIQEKYPQLLQQLMGEVPA